MHWLFVGILFLHAAAHGKALKCDATCGEESIKYPLELGKSYIYKYRTVQDVNSLLGKEYVANQTANIEAEITLTAGEGVNRCQVFLSICYWRATFPQLTVIGEPPVKILEFAFKDYARFTYINGAIKSLCLPDDEVWKNNIRRSIISLVQTNLAHLNTPNGESEIRDIEENGLGGRRISRYYRFGDPLHLHKVAFTSSNLEKIIKEKGLFDTLLASYKIQDPNDLRIKYADLFNETQGSISPLDSLEICSYEFEDTTTLKDVDCTQNLIRTGRAIQSQLSTRSRLTLARITETDVNNKLTSATTLMPSSLTFDNNFEKPSKDPTVLQAFEQMIRTKFCKQVLDTSSSREMLEYMEMMRKLVKRISKADLDRNFEFVAQSLDCGVRNRKRQTQLYLTIAASSPTDETVEFFAGQIQLGNVETGTFKHFLKNVAIMELPGPSSLRAMNNLLLNRGRILSEIEIIELLLPASNMARVYQNSLKSSSSIEEGRVDLINLLRAIGSAAAGMSRLVKMEVLKGLHEFGQTQDLETCQKLAKDDFEKLKCSIPFELGSLEFAAELLNNETAQTDARILAYLYHMEFFSRELGKALFDDLDVSISNEEVKAFTKSYMQAMNDMDDDTPVSGGFQRSRTFVKFEEFGNSNHMNKYELNVISGTSAIPRLISADYTIITKGRPFRYLEMEITTSNIEEDLIEVLIVFRRYGVTFYLKSLSISPSGILSYLQNKELIRDDVFRFFVSKIPTVLNLIRDRHFEYLRFNKLMEISAIIPTISGLPFIQNTEFDLLLSLNLTVQKLAELGKSESGPTEIQLAPKFARKHLEKNSWLLGTNEILGYQHTNENAFGFGTMLSLTKELSGRIDFQVRFPKHLETNETLHAFSIEEVSKFQKVQLLEHFTQHQFSEFLDNDSSEELRESQSSWFGTNICEKVVTHMNRYHLRTKRCKMSDWFFTFLYSDSEQKSVELKLHPSQPSKENSFNIKAAFSGRLNVDNEIDLFINSPYKELHLNWHVSNHNDNKISATLRGKLDKFSYEVEVYLIQPLHPTMEARNVICWEKAAVCRLRRCGICSFRYEFGIITNNNPMGDNIVNTKYPLHGYFDTGFENSVVLFAESKGIHKYLDSLLRVRFEEYQMNSSFPDYDSWFGHHYNLSLYAKNNYIGQLKISALLKTVGAWITFRSDKLDRETEFDASVILFNATELLNFTINDNNISLRLEHQNNVITVRSSQFPIYDFQYSLNQRKSITSDDTFISTDPETYQENATLSYKFTRLGSTSAHWSVTEHSIGLVWERDWKHLSFQRWWWRNVMFGRPEELSDISSFDIKNILKVYHDNSLMGTSRIDAIRQNSSLKSLGFQFQDDLEEETITIKFLSSSTDFSLKAQTSIMGILHKTDHHMKYITSNKWNYTGEYDMVPGKGFKAFGTVDFLESPRAGVEMVDLTVTSKERSDLVKIIYTTTAGVSTKFRMDLLRNSEAFFEFKVEHRNTHPNLPVQINLSVDGLLKTELVLYRESEPSVITFVTRLVPIDLKCNGTLTHKWSNIPLLIILIDFVNERDPLIYGRIESDSKIDMMADLAIQSRTTYSFQERTSNLTILSSYDVDYIPSPLIYINFTDLDGQVFGANLTTVLELDNSDNYNKPERELGLALTLQRPSVQPFYFNISVQAFQLLEFLHEPGPGELYPLYAWVGRNFSAIVHFVHRQNVLYLVPSVDTDLTLAGDLTLYENHDRETTSYRDRKWNTFVVSLNSQFKEDSVTPPKELKLQNRLECNLRRNGSDFQYQGSLQKYALIYQALGSLKRFYGGERSRDRWVPRSLLEEILSTVDGNENVLHPTEELWYQLSRNNVESAEKKAFLKGSHNLTRYFESWKNFEGKITHDLQCGERAHLSWTDRITRNTNGDKHEFHLSSSKIFELQSHRDHNSTLGKFSIFHPEHKLSSSLSVNSNHSTPSENGDMSFNWNADGMYEYRTTNTGELKITHTKNDRKQKLEQIYRTIIKGRVNQCGGQVNHFSEIAESQYASSMKHSVEITNLRDQSKTYRYLGSSVVGQIEGFELLHHDYTISVDSDNDRQIGFNGSITVSSPAKVPQLIEWTSVTNFHTCPDLTNEFHHKEKFLLLLGKIPDSDCQMNSEKSVNLNEEGVFPIDLTTFTKLAKHKLLCNEYTPKGIEKYTEFRKQDGRMLMKYILYNGTLEDSGHSFVATNEFNANWEDKKCTSGFEQSGQRRNNKKIFNDSCNLALKALPTCLVQPDSFPCRPNKRIWDDKNTRRAVSFWTSLGNLAFFGLSSSFRFSMNCEMV